MASQSPFLSLAGELRNAIYELVVIDSPELGLFDGRVALPALGCVCRQIRTEMRGIFEQHEADLILAAQSNRTVIEAKVINYDFTSLSTWLSRHELLPNEPASSFRTGQTRTLHIDLVVDVPLVDPEHSANSELALQVHIARDRDAIQSFNDSWDDSKTVRQHFYGEPQYTFAGPSGNLAASDEHGALICALYTPASNYYAITCDVRLNYISTSDGSSSGPFPSGFRHQGDYLDQLFGQTPYGGPWCLGYKWGPDASSFFKLVFAAMSRARSCRSGMSIDARQSRLTH
jgi:hypothetical protein